MFCPFNKTIKSANKLSLFYKSDSRRLSIFFYKLIVFETLIIFLELTIKLIIGIFDLQK